MSALLKNRAFVTQLVGLALALLALVGIALPAGIDKDSVVAVAMLGIAVATIVYRYAHEGAPDADGKPWWMSRTLWIAVIAFIFGVLGLFGITPPIDQEGGLGVVMLLLSIPGAYFAAKAKRPIG